MNKGFLHICLVAFITFLCLPEISNCQEGDSFIFCHEFMSFDAILNTDVVSAGRRVQKKNEAAGSVVVVSAEMIKQRGYRNLEEVLEDVPGIDFTTRQPEGEYPTHFICRGISDVGQTNLLIIVDGVICNDVSNGWFRHIGFDFPLIDVERIEIIFGPGSALYGANAYAGIVYIVTKSADQIEKKNQFDTRLSYGSFNTISPEIYYSTKFNSGLKLQFTGQWFYTNGDGGLNRYDPGNYWHNNYEPDSVLTTEYGNIANEKDSNGKTKMIPDGFRTDINDFSFRFRANHGGLTLGLSYWQKDEGLGNEVVGYEYFANTPGLRYNAFHSGKSIFTKYEFDINSKLHSNSLIYFTNTQILPQTGFIYTFQYQSVNNGQDSAVVDKVKGYSGQGTAVRFEQQFNLTLPHDNELIFGFHLETLNRQYFGISIGEEQDKHSTIVGKTFPNGKTTVMPVYFSEDYSFFVQDEMKLFKTFTLTAGLRYDYSSDFGDVLIPRLALVGNISKKLSIKALYGKAFKAPTVFELYDEWRGNTDLSPQYISTYEAELNFKATNTLNFRGNFYFNDIKDLIVVAQNPDPTVVKIGPNGEKETYYQNLGNTSISGLSLNTDYKPLENLLFSINYSYSIGDQWKEIDNIAKNKVNFSMNYVLKEIVVFNLRANYVGKVKAPATNLYFYPKTAATINEVGYDYVTESNPDGFLEDHLLLNFTISTRKFFSSKLIIEPQLIFRNLLGTEYYTIGRQAGSGVRPVSDIQSQIQNPDGYIPAYHPQGGREIHFRILAKF